MSTAGEARHAPSQRDPEVTPLASGATARLTGAGARAVVCVNGGSSAERPGTWSATLEWLVRALAPRFPELLFVEVRYRVRSWQRLAACMEDCRAAVDLAAARGAERVLLLGFSMGGAVAIGVAGHAAVERVLGLAPWIPDRIDGSTLEGKRLDVIHGRLDAWLPGLPGVSWRHTLQGVERIRARGTPVSFTLVPGAVHGMALRAPWGLVRLPRAGRWEELAAVELGLFGAAPLGERGRLTQPRVAPSRGGAPSAPRSGA